ncbi:MAG: hypothetical protein AAF495_21780 [Pseudomonadota bacterium]
MDDILWIGSALGALFGLLHGVWLFRLQAARPGSGQRAKGIYYGIWAFILWTLFGAYVLIFWLLGLIGSSIARLKPRRSSA